MTGTHPLNDPLARQRKSLKAAFLFSLGLHLILIFGVLLSPRDDSEVSLANRAVTIVLTPTATRPDQARFEAAADQDGSLLAEERIPGEASLSPTARIAPLSLQGDSNADTQAPTPPGLPDQAAAARQALEADYVRQWQARIEQFGNHYYQGLAMRHGTGDVRLRVRVAANGALRNVDLLASSGIGELDRAAIDTVERLAPFAAFPDALAREARELEIIRTWQFRR